jgi:hypothetical protein
VNKHQKRLDDAAQRYYPTCRVYVTFELESEQRRCKQAMEVPDISAYLNLKKDVLPEHMYRGENVLDVVEPPEPDAILWEVRTYDHGSIGAYSHTVIQSYSHTATMS